MIRLTPLWRDRRGVAAVEFALIAPVLLVLFLVGMGLSDAIACNRKVTTTARSLTDLVTRYTALTSADATSVMNASVQVMAPYDAARAVVRISQIKVTGTTTGQVIWSQTRGGTALTAGATVTLPSGIAATDSYLILGEVSYDYAPPFRFANAQALTLYDAVYMSPRLADQVPLS